MKQIPSVENWLNGVDESNPRQVLKGVCRLISCCGEATSNPVNQKKIAGQIIATWWPKTLAATPRLRPSAARALKELEHIVDELLSSSL